jgi:cytochrome c oxidase cbb3-type subunit IV
MDFVEVRIVWTVLTFVVFVAILAWAYSGRARRGFDAAAQLPFADDATDAADRGSRGGKAP